jgi:hypothetical protein
MSDPRMKLEVRGRKDGRFTVSLTGAPLGLAQNVIAHITESLGMPSRTAPPGICAVFAGDLMECSYFVAIPEEGEDR